MGIKHENISNQGAESNKKKRETKWRDIEASRTSQIILNEILIGVYTHGTTSSSYNCRKIKCEDDSGERKNCLQLKKDEIPTTNSTSMSSLIVWNISKALELNPYMDLKVSIKEAQYRLDSESRDLNSVLAQQPEQQHLVCAVLAWQQLGHTDADSLYKFIESKRKEVHNQCKDNCKPQSSNKDKPTSSHCCREPTISKCADSGSFGSHLSGPVVKLPVETKVIMRLDNSSPRQIPKKVQRGQERDIMSKIDAACCMDTACAERLATLDATTSELRSRASKLARREAERVELLERAEAAWKDLEIGYQRRLALAEEKEEDINKQIQKIIAERNGYKNAFTTLSLQLKDRGDAAEKMRAKLTEVEKQVCDRACVKLRLSEECTKGEALLAEHQCRAAQLERDLQFKEEQARRKLISLQNEADSARTLTHEAERAMRAELSGLRDQIAQVSNELLEEEEENVRLKEEHEQLRKEKSEIIEDLEGCKTMCDLRMQGQIDKLKEKKDLLNGVKDQVMECRCKMPVDETVEVKRTPSLAALCRCAPEDRLLESCSCTSLRGRLLTNLLADLFGGLQTELSGSGSQMPCQLLKCLEDKHNWDRASVVKTNLRNFFSKLLMGELDIAIATAIENYHAKWVGASCADVPKMTPEPGDDLSQGWQQRALEKRAQKMATQLAEQLFEERAEQLAQRAKDIVTSGPPPCTCHPPASEAAAYPVLVESNMRFGVGTTVVDLYDTPTYWKRTIQDVTQLRLQIEDLKKESIKKEDLKLMEDKITKIVKQASGTENENLSTATKDTSNFHGENSRKETRILRAAYNEEFPKYTNQNKSGVTRKKPIENNSALKKTNLNEKPSKQNKRRIHGQSYAVNLCLCGPHKNGKHAQNPNNDGKSSWKPKPSRDIVPQNSSVRQTKPININLLNPDIDEDDSKTSAQASCTSNCKCFNKAPSNTSIDKLLETLTKWKFDLADPQEKCIKNIKSSLSKYSKNAIKDSMRNNNQNDSKINLSISTVSQKEQVNESDIYRHTHKVIVKNTRPGHFKHPITTESEYMAAVNLDKSNEEICKCIKKIESPKENNQEENKNEDIPFKCINSNACECKIYQEMQKDNKNSQTEELNKVEIANQSEGVQIKDSTDLKKLTNTKVSNQVNNQKERKSDTNNVTQETELFPSNCDYYIKFLGVTLADLNSYEETKQVKNVHHTTDDFLISRDKCIERRKKHQKKLSNIDPSDSYTKPNVITVGLNDHSKSFDKPTKCECNARFDEFKSFITNIFAKQLQDNTATHKDEGLDSQSFKYTENTLESCVCCNSFNVDDSKDLELNAFHLLEDHLKGKLEEFKSFSCKSSCIPPEEEEKLFSAILQRVKQVISDCANEMKCSCPGSLPTDGSWSRAYGLLQEYLKIKIKRVQCLCVFNDNKNVALPDILDKVCNLIETDFQRLKDICKCKNSNDMHKKKIRIEDLLAPANEAPERDTNICKTKLDLIDVNTFPVVKTLSKQNSNNSMIVTENISSQVPPNLGMDTKSCNVSQLGNKNAQTTETDIIITNSKSNGVMYKTCDCCYNTEEESSENFSEMFETKEIFVNLYTDTVKNTNPICESTKYMEKKLLSKCLSVHKFDNIKTVSEIDRNENDENKLDVEEQVINDQTLNVPYIGYTVDCSCDRSLGTCVCMKSVIQANNDKIDTFWKEILANSKNCKQDFSYIMHGHKNKDDCTITNCNTNSDKILKSDMPEEMSQYIATHTCETEISVKTNEDEIVLKNSNNIVNTIHHTTNTFDENLSLGTSCSNSESPLDWYECPISEERPSTVKLTNSIYFPVPIDDYKKTFNSDTMTDIDIPKIPQTCDCDRVPICHVKMLVENIEKNLIESKCTCDSLISRVCPVHSKKHT